MTKEIFVITKNDSTFDRIGTLVQHSGVIVDGIERIDSVFPFKKIFNRYDAGLFIVDLTDQKITNCELADDLKTVDPNCSIILLNNTFTIEDALKLGRAGASDLIEIANLDAKLINSVESIFSQRNHIEKKLNISDMNQSLEEILNNHVINSLPGIFFYS